MSPKTATMAANGAAIRLVPLDHPGLQRAFHCLQQLGIEDVHALGNNGVMLHKLIALFCSVRCPGDLIVKTYDLARALRDAGAPVIGGFHSPIEKDCLELLLRGKQPVVVCPARGLEAMRLPSAWKTALGEGRLLLLSAYPASIRRPTADLARKRNEFVAAIADVVFIAHAAPGSGTEAVARSALGWGKPVLTLQSPANARLVEMGARPVGADWPVLASRRPRP